MCLPKKKSIFFVTFFFQYILFKIFFFVTFSLSDYFFYCYNSNFPFSKFIHFFSCEIKYMFFCLKIFNIERICQYKEYYNFFFHISIQLLHLRLLPYTLKKKPNIHVSICFFFLKKSLNRNLYVFFSFFSTVNFLVEISCVFFFLKFS